MTVESSACSGKATNRPERPDFAGAGHYGPVTMFTSWTAKSTGKPVRRCAYCRSAVAPGCGRIGHGPRNPCSPPLQHTGTHQRCGGGRALDRLRRVRLYAVSTLCGPCSPPGSEHLLRRVSTTVTAAFAVAALAGCAAGAAGSDSAPSSGASVRPTSPAPKATPISPPSAVTAGQADEQIKKLFSEVLAPFVAKSRATEQGGEVGPVPKGALVRPCTAAGAVHHVVSSLAVAADAGRLPGLGTEVRGRIEQEGWTFSPWESVGGELGSRRSTSLSAGYLLSILDTPKLGYVQLIGVPPCLPGKALSTPSMFP